MKLQDYVDANRRMVINIENGKFAFVHEVHEETIEIFYPFEETLEKVSNDKINFDILDGK